MKTNLLGIILILCCTCLSAQDTEVKRWHLGLLLSLDQNQTDYTLSDWVFQGVDDIKNLDAKAKIGFSGGFAVEYRISNTTSLRFSPLLSIQKNDLIFIDQDNQPKTIAIHPRTIGLPFHFVYAPRGREKIPYFFIGPRWHRQIGKAFDPAIFSISPTNLSAEFGMGMTVYSKVFSISPQLSFSQGISNLKAVGESGLYNNAVRSIRSDRLSLGVIIGLVQR